MDRRKLYKGYASTTDYQRQQVANQYQQYLDEKAERIKRDRAKKEAEEKAKKEAEEKRKKDLEAKRQAAQKQKASVQAPAYKQQISSTTELSPFISREYQENQKRQEAAQSRQNFNNFLNGQRRNMYDTIEQKMIKDPLYMYTGDPVDDAKTDQYMQKTTPKQTDGVSQYIRQPEEPDWDYYLSWDGYRADAWTTFGSSMNEMQANNYAGKKLRMQNISDVKTAVDIALENDEKRALLDQYSKLQDAYYAIPHRPNKEQANLRADIIQQISNVKMKLARLYPEEAANGTFNDVFLANQQRILGPEGDQYLTDIKAKSDLKIMVNPWGSISPGTNSLIRKLGLWLHSDDSKDKVKKDSESASGVMDHWFGDDVYEGLEHLNGYISASKEDRKKMSEKYNKYVKDRNEYWEAARQSNLRDKAEWDASHKVSDWFNYKTQTASDDIVQWNGIKPSLNWDNIMYKNVQQLGYSSSSWDKQTAAFVLQGAATLSGNPWLAGALSASGASIQYQAGKEENNGQVLEDYQQRLKKQLEEDGVYKLVISRGKNQFKGASEQEILKKIVDGDWNPQSSEANPSIAKALTESFVKSRRGVNATFDKDMMAVANDAMVNFALYSAKLPKGFGSAINSGLNHFSKYVVAKNAVKSFGKQTLEKAGMTNAGKYTAIMAKDFKSGFGTGYSVANDVSQLTGVGLGTLTGATKAVGKKLGIPNTKLYQTAAKAATNTTEMITSLPSKLLRSATNKISDPRKAFLVKQGAKKAGKWALQMGKRQFESGFSESIEEGKQYLNGQDWINNADPDQVVSFFDVALNDMSMGNSLITAALGIPFGAKWGLAATDGELYANMTGGWLGGALHTTSVNVMSSAAGLLGGNPMTLDKVVAHNALLDQNTMTNKFVQGTKIARQVYTAAGKEQFDSKFDEFQKFNQQRIDQGVEGYTEEQLQAEKDYAQQIYKIANSGRTKAQAKNLGIREGSQQYAKFVAAKAMYTERKKEDQQAISATYDQIQNALTTAVQNEQSAMNLNTVADENQSEPAHHFLNIFEDPSKGDIRQAIGVMAELTAIDRILNTMSIAKQYAERANNADVNWVMQTLEDRKEKITRDLNHVAINDILFNDPLSYVENQDSFNNLVDLYQAQQGNFTNYRVSKMMLDTLYGENIDLEPSEKKMFRQMGFTDGKGVIKALDKNVKNHYQLLDNIEREYETRSTRRENAEREAAVEQTAVQNETDQFMSEDPQPLFTEGPQVQEGGPVIFTPEPAPVEEPTTLQEPSQQPLEVPTIDPQQTAEQTQTEAPTVAPESSQTPSEASYGSTNTVFTKAVLDDALAQLKAMRGQLNSGINPAQMLEIGIKIFGYHIEAGSRKFVQCVVDTYNTFKDNGFRHDEIRDLSKNFKKWYGSVIMDDSLQQYADEFDDPTTVRNTDVTAIIDRLEFEDSVQAEQDRLWEEYKQSVMTNEGLYKTYDSLDQLLDDINFEDGKVAIIDRTTHTVKIFNTNKDNTVIDEHGAVYMKNGVVLPEDQRNRTEDENNKPKNLAQEREFDALNRQIEKDNSEVVGVSGHDYFVKEGNKTVLYPRVHTVLGDQYETKKEETEDKDKFLSIVGQYVSDRNYSDLEDLVKDKVENYKLYIDVLKQDDTQDSEVVEALASILARGDVGVSVDLGNIVDEIVRIFFDNDARTITPLVYETYQADIRGNKVSIANFVSKQQFEDLLNDLEQVRQSYKDYKISTKKHTWHAIITLPDNTIRRVAGETDLVAVDSNGNYHIIDTKTGKSTFAKTVTRNARGEEFISYPFDEDSPLYDGRKAYWSRKRQYERQLSMYMLLMKTAMPTINFASMPIEILPIKLDYEYRTIEGYINSVVSGKPNTVLVPLMHEMQNGRNGEPQTIPLDVQQDIYSGVFMQTSSTQDEHDRKIIDIQEKMSKIEQLYDDIDTDIYGKQKAIESKYGEQTDDVFKYVTESLKKIKLQVNRFNNVSEENLTDQRIEQFNDIATTCFSELANIATETERLFTKQMNKPVVPVQPEGLDERNNDAHNISELCTKLYNESFNWANNQSPENYIKLSDVANELKQAIEDFRSKYDNPTELNYANQLIDWFAQQVKPVTPIEFRPQKPVVQPTTDGFGWRDHNTADKRSVNASVALDDNSLRLQDVSGNPDFDQATFEVVTTSMNRGQMIITVRTTYNGHTYSDIDIQVANNPKGTAIMQALKEAQANAKPGQKVVLTGMNRTAGIVKVGPQVNMLQSPLLYGQSIYDISTESSQFMFGLGKLDKTTGTVRVMAQGSTESGESKIYEFAKGHGTPGVLYSIIRPAYKNTEGRPKPLAHNVYNEKITSEDADLIIEMLGSVNTPNYEVTFEDGTSANIPLSHRDIVNLFLPYGTYNGTFRTAKHVRADGRTVTITYEPTSSTDPGRIEFNLDNDASVQSLKNYLMSCQVNIDEKRIGCRLGEASSEKHPFKRMADWFRDSKRSHIQEIQLGKSRIKFSREDFSNPAVKGDVRGISGLAWMMKNNMLSTTYDGISNPRFSFTSADLQQTKTEDDGTSPMQGQIEPTATEEPTDLDLFMEGYEGSWEHKQLGKSSKTISKESAINNLRKLFGNKVDVNVVENIAKFVRNTSTYAVGKIVGDTIYLAENAEYGTEYHEAFHRVSRLILSDKMRNKLFKGLKKAMVRKYGERFAEEANDRQYEEFGANLCHRYFNNIENVKFDIKKPFEFIRQHYQAFKEVGSFRMYMLYVAMQNGVFKFFDSDEQKKASMQEDLKYQIRGASFEHIFNDKMYDTLKRSLVYYVTYLQNIRTDGKNLNNLDLTQEMIDKKFVKVKRNKNGKKMILSKSLREILNESCKTELGKRAMNELLDNWEAVKPDVENYLGELGIDYNEVQSEITEDGLNGDEEDMNSIDIEQHTKASYETARYTKATSGIRFFTSMIKETVLDEDGHKVDKRNELGFYEFMDSHDVINKILSDCHKVKSPSEMISEFKRLSNTDTMYSQIYELVKGAYDHIVKPDGTVHANNEQFVTQLFNLVASAQMVFKRLNAKKDKKTKMYSMTVEDCGQEYEALQYRKDWGVLLTSGGTDLFMKDENGKIQPKSDKSILYMGSVFDRLKQIKDEFSELRIHELNEGDKPTLKVQGRTVNITDENDIRFLKRAMCDMFNYIGIQISKPELDYMLRQKYPEAATEHEQLKLFMQAAKEENIEQLWLGKSMIKKVDGKWQWNVDENNNIFGTKTSAENMFVSNSFLSELSKYKYRYQHASTELSVLVSGGNTYFVMSENNLISDVTDEISDGKDFAQLLQQFCYNIVNDIGQDENGVSVEKPIGSILAKLAKAAIDEGKKVPLNVCTLVQFKTDEYGDEGSGYFEIGEREDYTTKATIIEQGGLVFPTMSDKKTWIYIDGVNLPGIQYDVNKRGQYVGVLDMSDTDAIDQLIEYAQTEYFTIKQTIEQLKTIPDSEKVVNFHSGPTIEDANKVKHKIANGTIFSSLTGIYDENDEYISFNRVLDEEGNFISPEDNLKKAVEVFFSKSQDEQRKMIKRLIVKQTQKELAHLEGLGLVVKNQNTGLYENVGMNQAAINLIAKKMFDTSAPSQYHLSKALDRYVTDIVEKSIMSIQEVERVYSGHPGFFKYKFKNGMLVDRSVDEFKRLGGLISTGVNNNLEIHGMPEDGMYTCAEVNNEMVGSNQIDSIRKLMSEGEWRQALRLIRLDGFEENVDREVDEIYDMKIEDVIEAVKKESPRTYDIISKKIEQEVSAYMMDEDHDGIDVADGGAYISPEMTEWLLRMCGEYDNKVQSAFEILKNPKSNITDQAKAYHTVTTKVIGAQKYTAYGMRQSSDKKTLIPYYNKMALFPVFKCIATGDFAKIYDQMQNNKNPDGTANPIHMLMVNSAVKVGSQGSQDYSTDDSFSFNTYKEPFNRLRKQFNTNPHHKEDQSMGTQMVKVALASLVMNNNYTVEREGKTIQIRGRQILNEIMSDIKVLSKEGYEDIRSELFGEEGIDQQKLSKFLNSQLTSRDADKSILDSISDQEDGHGNHFLKHPLAAISRMSWLQSIITSFINKRIVEVHTPGNAFYQRSIWRMEGDATNIMNDENLPESINEGKELKMIIEDGPAKGAMDCVLTIDYFADVLKDAGLDKASFKEQKQALIEAGIIGQGAKANFICYRIPTQAQSSIHALRCVDVLPVIQHNIIMPKEFTRITGSDFDIDKLYIGSLNFKLRKATDSWYNDNITMDSNTKKSAQNRLINNYISVLTDQNGVHIANRSIDNDTDLITKGVLKDLEEGKSTSSEVKPYDFYCLSTHTRTKNDFLTGKTGIGPFALNNNSQILTMLYGVKFKYGSIMDKLHHGRLDRTTDDDKQSILSWISALINAHVDIAKDPYISRLNVNQMTYNLTNLLIRTGYGQRTFWFTTQPVMKAMADKYRQAQGKFMQEEGKSSYVVQKEAKLNAAIEMCGKERIKQWEKNFKEEGKWTNIAFDYANIFLSGNDEVLRRISKGERSDFGKNVLLKYLSYEDTQAIVYFIDQMLEQPAQAISNLVQYSKIDTKKQGKNVSEQLAYLKGVAETFGDYSILTELYGYEEKKDGFKIKDEDLYDGQFDFDSIQNMYKNSFIQQKTKDAIFTFMEILKDQVFEAAPGFQNIVSRLSVYLGKYDSRSINEISQAVAGKIKAEAINRYAYAHNINIPGLVSGQNTIYDRLNVIKCKILSDPEYADMLDGNGAINNVLLNLLIADKSWQYNADNHPGRMQDKLQNLKFVRLFDALDVSSAKRDYIIQAWDDLLNDNKHKDLRKFAEDLCVYAYVTSADQGGSKTIFSYVPNSFRENSGYVQYIREVLADLQDHNPSSIKYTDEFIDDIILNNWNNYTFIPSIKLEPKNNGNTEDIKWQTSVINSQLDDVMGNKYKLECPILISADPQTPVSVDDVHPFIKIQMAKGKANDGSSRSVAVYKLAASIPTEKKGYVIPTYVKVNPRGYEIDGYRYYEYGQHVEDQEYFPSVEKISGMINQIEQQQDVFTNTYGPDFLRIAMDLHYAERTIGTRQTEVWRNPTIIPSKEGLAAESLVITGNANTTAQKSKEINGVDTLRHPDTNGMHFGNPFSHTNYKGVQKVMPNVKEAVIAFEQWLRGEAYQDIEPERRQWILDQINSGQLDNKPLVYYTDKVPDNSYGRTTYDYNEAPNHAHILQKLINEHTKTTNNVRGENISSNGSEFAKQLTNPGNNLTVTYKGKTFRNAEHAYQTWKSGEFDEDAYNSTAFKPIGSKPVNKHTNFQTMVEILTAKLQQHPELVDGINQRGGILYLESSTHNVIGDKYWETKTGQNAFIKALIQAYNSVVNNYEKTFGIQSEFIPSEEELAADREFHNMIDTSLDAEIDEILKQFGKGNSEENKNC